MSAPAVICMKNDIITFLTTRATIINYHSAHINGVGWCTVQNWYCAWRNGREAYLFVFKLKENHSDLQLFIMNLTFSYCIKSILDLFLQCRRDLQVFGSTPTPKNLHFQDVRGKKIRVISFPSYLSNKKSRLWRKTAVWSRRIFEGIAE